MELSKKNLIIVGAIILALLLGIVLLGNTKNNRKTTVSTPSKDFNEIEEKEVVIVATDTPIPTVVLTSTPSPSPTPPPTFTPTSIPTPTIKLTSTPKPTRSPTSTPKPTATPTPDTSIKASGVSLSTTELNLEINTSYQILSRVEPNDTTDKSLNWSSSNGNITTVDSNGNIHAKNLGESIITAKTKNGKTTIVKVKVVNQKTETPDSNVTPEEKVNIYPESIIINYETLDLKVDEIKQMRINFIPVNVTDFSTIWSSSNANVATIDIRGMVTAKTPGTTIITAKTINDIIVTSEVMVFQK